MAEFFSDYALFLIKTVSIAAVALFLLASLVGILRRAQTMERGELHVRRINDHLRDMQHTLEQHLLDRRAGKARQRQYQREEKRRRKGKQPRPHVYVLDFHGDIRASQVRSLREEITAIVSTAEAGEEVVLRLESTGGMVHGYGLAASQLQRLRDHQLRLTVTVDKVAASGGYLMACVADRILAAPFAILGSIGVVAQIPNFHRLLQKHRIDFEQHTAGEHKRTLTMFGRNTDAARQKFREELDETHHLFKRFVAEHRPSLDMDRVATGEYWFGRQAHELGLADEIRTSDEYLLTLSRENELYHLSYRIRPPLQERLAGSVSLLWRRLLGGMREEDRDSRFLRG